MGEQDPTKCTNYGVRDGYGAAPVPSFDPVPHTVVVTGAGHADTNGVYTYSGIYNGYPAYCKGTSLTPDQTFTIAECGWSNGCGLLWYSSGWGWGTGCAGHNRYMHVACTEKDPTKCTEYVVRDGYGTAPVPSIHY